MNYYTTDKARDIITQDVKDRVKDFIGTDVSELHHRLYNEDYYIIGYYQAEQWLKANTSIFEAIGAVSEYEKNEFGEATTDLSSSENLVNMYVYIAGNEVLNDCSVISEYWEHELTEEIANEIIENL